MDALTQMIAYGWPLALAGFVLGALAGGWAARKAAAADDSNARKAGPDADSLAALAEELQAAKALLEAEEREAGDVDVTLKDLDEAVKRANGRLKLVSKALKQPK
ncbi:hypothetical protein [Hyphococcus luteus]|uniref:Uncharacterized protein n=1 Tax=Hyphococcus luteus TaxID=2058213 RepID=A0A2S7K9Y4_9PROT|nr:hypothetical protein [Marinicaulis flavus]PQA89330.1 hypothetical protein CW354_00170 [Marinicaulis flavus]